MNSFSTLWEQALKQLEFFYEQNNNNTGFRLYVKTMVPEFEYQGNYYFKVSDAIFKEQINHRFLWKITEVLQSLSKAPGNIQVFVFTPEELDQKVLECSENKPVNHYISLNPNYTFDSFVVGPSNKLAEAASRAVAQMPGSAYNPLFIYGGVGLGKTHLMHAIGNKILQDNPAANIIYITSESFTNEYIESIQKKKNDEFRRKFRNADVLLIDDIQFISRAVETQGELFHTFNTLYENNKQIIFSSDKPPSEIPKLEERLLSRFQWGLLTDIGLPDYETRVAILMNKMPMIKKITMCDLEIDDEVLHYIASEENTNIRDLEGALKRVIASALMERNISSIHLPLAQEALKNFFGKPAQKTITPSLVLKRVCEYFSLSEEEILSKKKNREIAFPRQIAMYLLRNLTNMTYPKIGETMGKDHSTIVHADNKVAELMEHDPETQTLVNDIIQKIKE